MRGGGVDDEAGPTMGPSDSSLFHGSLADRLAAIGASFAMVNTVEEFGRCSREAIEGFIGPVYNGLYLWDPATQGLRLLYSVGFSDEERIEAERTAIDRHPGEVFRSGQILHVPDVLADTSSPRQTSPRSFEVRSRLLVPVAFRSQVFGVFGLASPTPNRFSRDDIGLLRFISRLAGVVHRRLLDHREHEDAQAASQSALARANADLLAAQRDLLATNAALETRVAERTRDLAAKNATLAEMLTTVERTREQMVQAEKMASLGLLVAGIAHEIKNPLNFVNNFAELSAELVREARDLLGGDDDERAEAIELLAEVAENLDKIRSHGQRANTTISSMLMHARDRPGESVTCDLNALAREHATLAYVSFRATNRTFSATLEFDVDPALSRIDIPLQEVSRVLINLVGNSCHALRARAAAADYDYEPRITITTRLDADAILIKVRDNGTGISEDVQRRLFVPFFTTKPVGEGTGLGLSMAYDIIVKQLGGELRCDSKVDEYTEFCARIPRARPRDEETEGTPS